MNHFAKVCKSKNVKEIEADEEHVKRVYNIEGLCGPTVKKIIVNGKPLDMLIDSGSDVTIISTKM